MLSFFVKDLFYSRRPTDWRSGFSAGLSSTISSSETNVIFNTIDANIGGHYDQTSGKFRAPIDGYYMFFFTGHIQSSNNMYIDLIINDSVYKDKWVYDQYNTDSYDTASNSIILHLNMGDEVNLRLHSGYYLYGSNRSSFSGFLLQIEEANAVCRQLGWKAGFSASLSSSIGTSETDIIFNVININIGGHYNQTSGKFRVPLDGYNMFFFNGYTYSTNEM
ncbi:PREDICTED: complement C1q tumor necrosis factor-related protein 4-like [Branchiostoma belcheri]|uniref:Complement C1q tumor necrosis factor-related protein 4-like n=1 Tax=Branchiostoma belcheri TaxID=7741 RepID=A0A6P4XVG0_BRABE|nr:PREDICTED: complement C1q tumor necrosis factor-related protein 4-like [Branchiostoma belcheri]